MVARDVELLERAGGEGTGAGDERHDYVLCTAELAECTCPDACECDHDND